MQADGGRKVLQAALDVADLSEQRRQRLLRRDDGVVGGEPALELERLFIRRQRLALPPELTVEVADPGQAEDEVLLPISPGRRALVKRAIDLERLLEVFPAAVEVALLADQLADAIERDGHVSQPLRVAGHHGEAPAADRKTLVEHLPGRTPFTQPDVQVAQLPEMSLQGVEHPVRRAALREFPFERDPLLKILAPDGVRVPAEMNSRDTDQR